MEMHDFHVQAFSENIVLATYRVYNVLNAPYSLRSSIWKRVDDQRKMHFHQRTLTNV